MLPTCLRTQIERRTRQSKLRYSLFNFMKLLFTGTDGMRKFRRLPSVSKTFAVEFQYGTSIKYFEVLCWLVDVIIDRNAYIKSTMPKCRSASIDETAKLSLSPLLHLWEFDVYGSGHHLSFMKRQVASCYVLLALEKNITHSDSFVFLLIQKRFIDAVIGYR